MCLRTGETMELKEARKILRYATGRQAWVLQESGLTDIKTALRVVRLRESATQEDLDVADAVSEKLRKGGTW